VAADGPGAEEDGLAVAVAEALVDLEEEAAEAEAPVAAGKNVNRQSSIVNRRC
jgi:hypothetical protein